MKDANLPSLMLMLISVVLVFVPLFTGGTEKLAAGSGQFTITCDVLAVYTLLMSISLRLPFRDK